MILPRTPLEDAKVSISSQLLDQNVTKEARHNIAPIISRLPTNRDTHGPSITTHLSTDPSDSSNTLPTDRAVSVPPEFPDLALPEYIESSFQGFDMDELLEADLALSEHDERELTLDSVFASKNCVTDTTLCQHGQIRFYLSRLCRRRRMQQFGKRGL